MVAILDPSSGNLSLAIAGHSPPYVPDARRAEFKLDGMPLGRNLNAKYEQVDTVIKPGEGLVFVGEGLISAKNDRGQVLGNERLQAVLDGLGAGGERTVGRLLVELSEFVGPGREQVDDVTIISLDRQSPRPLHG
jgi:serine phosphatase RsbU (regulator of sigma subunit)